MNKKFLRSTILTISILLGLTPSFSFQKNDEINQKQDNHTDYSEPSLDDNSLIEKMDFSSSVNKFLNAKEIKFDSLSLSLYPKYSTGEKFSLDFTSLDIDLSTINTTNINLSSNLKISYKGIEENLNIKIKTTDLYIIHRGNAIRLEVPKTINDVFSIFKAIGIDINSTINIGNVSLSDVISKLTNSTYKKEESVDFSGYKYNINFLDLSISNSTISNLNLIFNTNTSNTITGIKSDGDILITDKDSNDKFGINFESKIASLNEVSTYQKSDNSGFNNITNSSSSLLSTIADIFLKKYNSESNVNENSTQVKVEISGKIENKINDTTTNSSYLVGDIKADLTNVFSDENKGEYAFNLVQKSSLDDSSDIYNCLNAYFNNETTYISIDDLFKGRINNSKIKNLFSLITDITSIPTYKEIDDDLNIIFKIAEKNSINRLLDGDYSAIYGIFNSYSFTDNSFSLSLNPSGLGLQGDEIKLSMHFDNENSTLSKMIISGIKIGNVTINDLTFKLDKFDEIITPDASLYDDYSSNVSIFENISSLLSSRRVNANYSLIYTDEKGHSIASDGKIAADLSNSISSTVTETKLSTLDGKYYLSFDLPNDKNDSALGQGVEMYYDPSVSLSDSKNGLLYFGYQYFQNENYEDLKESNKYVFKNSIASDDISKMYQIIDKKIDSNTDTPSISIESMSSFISQINSSEKFKTIKNNIKNNLSLMDLKGIISISSKDDGITISLDPKEFIINSSYQDNTESIIIKMSADGKINELSMKGKINSREISFTISFSDTEFSYSSFNIDDYPLIDNASIILDSFLALPTDLKHFDISADGTLKKNDNDLIKISDSGASVDLTSSHDQASGIMNLYHPDINDSSKLISSPQKLEFYYQELDDVITRNDIEVYNGDFILEYNDNMHIRMNNTDLFDIADSISTISESNLLNRYIKLLNDSVQSNSAPLMKLINGTSILESKILEKPYIQEVSFKDSQIDLTIDPSLLLSDAKTGSYTTISVFYDTTSKHITKSTIRADYIDTNDNKYSISFCINLSALSDGENGIFSRDMIEDKSKSSTDKNVLKYTESTSSNFIDVYGMKMLIQCGIDTTENNYMEIGGTFYLKIGGIGSIIGVFGGDNKLYVKCYASIYIEDETVYCYLKFAVSTSSTFPTIKQDGYRVSEFFIKEDEVLVNQTKTDMTSHGGFLGIGTKYTYTTSYESYKTTGENITSNIAYYLLDYIMDLGRITGGETAINQVYSSMNSSSDSSITIKNDFSSVLNEFTYSNNSFYLDLNLASILTIPMMSISKLNMTITHDTDEDRKPLKSIALNAVVTVAGVLTVEINSSTDYNTFTMNKLKNITAVEAKSTYMTRYYTFRDNFFAENGEYDDESTCQMYLISSVTSKSNPTYTGTLLTKSYTSNKSSSKDYTITGYEDDYHFFIW